MFVRETTGRRSLYSEPSSDYRLTMSNENAGRFQSTQWSVVIAAADRGEHSQAAMESLCRAYWTPLYYFAQRSAKNVHDAQDLTQAFFEKLLAKEYLVEADRTRGRFRSFLITSFRNFLSNERDRAHALKRGGGRSILSLNFESADVTSESWAADYDDPEKLYERKWAETVLLRVMSRIEREQERAGRAREFHALRPFIGGRAFDNTIAAVAETLQCTESTARMAVSRLRQRYRELLRLTYL